MATSSSIGLEHELAAVHDLLRASRLVTLIGIGGVGKTRLALQVAAGLTGAFPMPSSLSTWRRWSTRAWLPSR